MSAFVCVHVSLCVCVCESVCVLHLPVAAVAVRASFTVSIPLRHRCPLPPGAVCMQLAGVALCVCVCLQHVARTVGRLCHGGHMPLPPERGAFTCLPLRRLLPYKICYIKIHTRTHTHRYLFNTFLYACHLLSFMCVCVCVRVWSSCWSIAFFLSLLLVRVFVLLSFYLWLNAFRTGFKVVAQTVRTKITKKKQHTQSRVCLCVCVGNIYGSMSDLLQLVPLHLIVSQMQKKRPTTATTTKTIEHI